MNITPADWMEQAEADLKAANDNITTKNYFVTANLSQQAAEKALKALYLKKEKRTPPKIHDVVDLARTLGAPENIIKTLSFLTPAYLQSKYPGAAPEIPVRYFSLEKSKRLLTLAQEVVQWTKSRL
ncbi:MAG: HEPN domain-containing protein [Nanoarchaeota archaeon]